jgi:hypothetical protein
MEQENILMEFDKLISHCKHEFDIYQELYDGVNDPYSDGRYYGAKEAYSDMLYKLQNVREKISKEEQ